MGSYKRKLMMSLVITSVMLACIQDNQQRRLQGLTQQKVKLPRWKRRLSMATDTSLPYIDTSRNNTELRNDENNPGRLFYNRVPKCGSTTMDYMIRAMRDANKFHYRYSVTYGYRHISEAEQRVLIARFMATPPPMLYNRHVYYINFTRHGKKQPAYINIVRKPMDAFKSRYHFWQSNALLQLRMDADKYNKTQYLSQLQEINATFDECIAREDSRCNKVGTYMMLIPFLCGQEPFCEIPSEASLAAAKFNLVHNYKLVGIVEDMLEFVNGLEYLLPEFFQGAGQWYREKKPRMNVSPLGQTYSPESVARMKDKLKEEYDMYFFTKQLFYQKAESWKKR